VRPLGPVNPDALTEWEERFEPVARRYRERMRHVVVGIFGGVVLSLLGLIQSGAIMVGMTAVGATLIVASLAWALTIPKLRCPSCDHELVRLDRYCPKCAAPEIELSRWWSPRCGDCGASLAQEGHRFRICYCSRCGVLVDRLGV
jgi:hypothetical protein